MRDVKELEQKVIDQAIAFTKHRSELAECQPDSYKAQVIAQDLVREACLLSTSVRTLQSVRAEIRVSDLEEERNQLRNLLEHLIDALPKCDQCLSPATCAFERGGSRWCDEHAPEKCPAYPRADPLRNACEFLGELHDV